MKEDRHFFTPTSILTVEIEASNGYKVFVTFLLTRNNLLYKKQKDMTEFSRSNEITRHDGIRNVQTSSGDC